MLQCRKRKQNKKFYHCVTCMKNYGNVHRERKTSLFIEMAQLLNFFSKMFPLMGLLIQCTEKGTSLMSVPLLEMHKLTLVMRKHQTHSR